MQTASFHRSEAALLLLVLLLTALACLGPPVAQPADYHQFADVRHWLGIPHSLDVLTNGAFAAVGVLLIARLRHSGSQRPWSGTRPMLVAWLAAGMFCTALGSSIYHWSPDDSGLALDRLGMSVAFAAVLGLAAQDRVSDRAGWALAGVIALAAPLAVSIWMDSGNLWPWVVLQAGGLLALLATSMLRPRSGQTPIAWWLVVLAYGLAKAAESQDHLIDAWSSGFVSGHNLKHLIAAAALWPVVRALRPAHNVPEHSFVHA